jgi:hypothetical protein
MARLDRVIALNVAVMQMERQAQAMTMRQAGPYGYGIGHNYNSGPYLSSIIAGVGELDVTVHVHRHQDPK